MHVRKLCIGLLAVGTLAACSDADRKTTVSNPATGESVTVRSGDGIPAPANLPDFAALYPGARIQTVMDGTGSGATGGQSGGMVIFHTADAPDKVIAFYRRRLDASALTERSEGHLNGAQFLTGSDPDGSDGGVQISVMPAEDEPGSFVTVVYNSGMG
ncbi:MAG: hypothetical protein ACK4Y4_09805 [Brevundimonas sp.]